MSRRGTYGPDSVVLVTGASRGIGRACAETLHRLGYTVYGTSRAPDACEPTGYRLLAMDATNNESIRIAIEAIMKDEGRLDVVVSNAGVSIVGAVEETTEEEMREHLEVNLLGYHRLWRAALPIMRARGQGRIVNVSSIAAPVAVPYQGVYSAAKAAVESLSEAMYHEVRPFGIDVVIVEPGNINTTIGESRYVTAAARKESAYSGSAKALETIAAQEQHGADPAVVATLLVKILRARRPRLRYSVGPFVERVAPWVKRLLPNRVLLKLVGDHYR